MLNETAQNAKTYAQKVLKSFKEAKVWGLEVRDPAREEDRENPWQKK